MKFRILFITFAILASTSVTNISFAAEIDTESLYINDSVHEVLQSEEQKQEELAVEKQPMNSLREFLLKDYLHPQNEKDKIISDILIKSELEPRHIVATESENTTDSELASMQQTNTKFDNGDFFWFRHYDFKTTADKPYYSSFTIPGNTIQIRYLDPETKEWVLTGNLQNKIPKTTLYITTDVYNIVISVPALYKKGTTNNTLDVLSDREVPIVITNKGDGTFLFQFQFAQDANAFGEIWALQSANTLIDFTDNVAYQKLRSHDLSKERRWSKDGYYFPTPSNYVPGGINTLYRHPANYTGSSFARYGGSLLADDLGYIMMQTCIKNQNEEGFWATGPKSTWLEKDFGIAEEFYDTRFNSDFATALIVSYQRYYDISFLVSSIRYAEFFMQHAEKHHYDVVGPSGETGWLVQDYAAKDQTNLETHSSLNHQLAEICFLYELYKVTHEEKYNQLADKMLNGIKCTYAQWVLPDNNLNYCLFYSGEANVMVDYPYLTYNDLYLTKRLLKGFGREEPVLQYLMDCKKLWMDQQGITGYLTDTQQ